MTCVAIPLARSRKPANAASLIGPTICCRASFVSVLIFHSKDVVERASAY
ncbi:Uncharacterised protein [Mycobacterium tuberculosis]|uniref:Uncharacterized protein n=1 Tax=Mycobacterium tuberculosis TaxID=1773 RepID=A0A916LEB4_MYCTX|nr:Uncharacterised protein [Mycobacterium tuberculosis]COX75682.1 Uncharacterised protein [Mycobacterium tuberculosis]COZ07234.1 Uncharacterised protein [Mycobacterium tuberculosis]COZ38611.1 Uncharacterised protein [Mycobacterium tuberculosis]